MNRGSKLVQIESGILSHDSSPSRLKEPSKPQPYQLNLQYWTDWKNSQRKGPFALRTSAAWVVIWPSERGWASNIEDSDSR